MQFLCKMTPRLDKARLLSAGGLESWCQDLEVGCRLQVFGLGWHTPKNKQASMKLENSAFGRSAG